MTNNLFIFNFLPFSHCLIEWLGTQKIRYRHHYLIYQDLINKRDELAEVRCFTGERETEAELCKASRFGFLVVISIEDYY